MELFWRIIIGLVIGFVGFMMVWKTSSFQTWTGRVYWAEEKFGGGGTNTFLKLIGFLVVVLGVFVMTGIFNDIGAWFGGIFVR